MAVSIDTTIVVNHNIVSFTINGDGAKLVLSSKPAGRPAQQTGLSLDITKTLTIMNAAPDASKSRLDDLEYAFLVYLRDNGYL